MLPHFETARHPDPENAFCPLPYLEAHATWIVREFEGAQVRALVSAGDCFETGSGSKFEIVDRENVRIRRICDGAERQFYLLFKEADDQPTLRQRREESFLLIAPTRHLAVFFGRFDKPPIPGEEPEFTELLRVDAELAHPPYADALLESASRLGGDAPKRQALRIFCESLRDMAAEYEDRCETNPLIERFRESVDVVVPIQ